MYIEEIIIDGFKSYASRTVIKGWDPNFTAITGLNGSGKSNILDAICFVLGIDNLRQIRATTLQDLIYKRGQAGVNRAIVSIVFNNEEPTKSPVGFQDSKQIVVTRQVVMGGKNKYLINGVNVIQQRVENLFQSVQLNVNHPHFLIMQGRITKVLNMKPEETLALIEETAGTRMYEEKKNKASQTLQKKDLKVKEISDLLDENIIPRLNKLRLERKEYLEYQVVQSEAQQLEKACIAYDYHQKTLKSEQLDKDLKENMNQVTEIQNNAKTVKDEAEALSTEIEAKKLLKKKSMSSISLVESETKLNEASNALVIAESQFEIQEKQLTETQKACVGFEHELEHMGRHQHVNNKDLEIQLNQKMELLQEKKAELLKLEELYDSLLTGIAKSGNQLGYAKLIEEEKKMIRDDMVEKERINMSISSLESELSKSSQHVTKWELKYKEFQHDIQSQEKAIDSLKHELDRMGLDSSVERELISNRETLRRNIELLQRDINTLSSGLSFTEFQYTSPLPQFDRTKVKGYIASIISLPEKHSEWASALELCAGAKLFNVVIETEKEASLLLEKGELKKRITFLPLNKIQGNSITPEKLAKIKKVAGETEAQLALHYIDYDQKMQPAMNFVFGNTVLCQTKDIAQAIAFDKSIHVRCITKDGDVYDPAGTMTGGTLNPMNSKGNGLLFTSSQIKKKKEGMAPLMKEMEEMDSRLGQMDKLKKDTHRMENEIELKTHQLFLYRDQRNSDPTLKNYCKYQEVTQQTADLKIQLKIMDEKLSKSKEKLTQYETDSHDLSSNRPKKIEDIEKSICELRRQLPKLQKEYNQAQDKMNQLELERTTNEHVQSKLAGQVSQAKDNALLLKRAIQALDLQVSALRNEKMKWTQSVQVEREKLFETDKEIQTLENRLLLIQESLEQFKLKVKKVNHSISKLEDEMKMIRIECDRLVQSHVWILQERSNFGIQGSEYEFSKINIHLLGSKLKEKKEALRKQSGSINRQVNSMTESLEKQETQLKENLNIVKQDKTKIEETIHKLNMYEQEALDKTWKKVNKDFGDIFGELLPGSFAQLVPLEGKDISEGLEIKVRLGGVWKKGLTELSGGQRSLVALGLILSLLQFKPAPMYILDEIDAALDLSHTQNIGHLFKTRFKGSQFIIVSLKDGLFSNAHVIFRTKFVDGVSVVERTLGNAISKKPK